MTELLVNNLVTLFVVVDPIGIAVIFSGLTRHGDRVFRSSMALRATILSTFILVAFFFIGEMLLRTLGIGQPAFRIAGGILLFMLAIDMVFARQSGLRSATFREREEAFAKEDISVFPLAFPLLAGPGAMTTVLLMADSGKTPAVTAGMVAIIFIIMGFTLLSLMLSARVMDWLGETGANVISRLLGLILAALAVQYIVDGVRQIAASLGI
ncbi:MarC family protein [Thiohalomonas denitrificans]|uniref:MarC family protein n=1 Tax=Thiohalomonas denitrificans TaxID=415747 RepID=UPI0026F31ACC|nr:MarC family protein [Thiohalomonas denitrificans]